MHDIIWWSSLVKAVSPGCVPWLGTSWPHLLFPQSMFLF